MLELFTLFMLSIVLSFDSFSIGLIYGLRQIKFPPYIIGTLIAITGITLLISGFAGHLLKEMFLSERQSSIAGGLLIVSLGIIRLFSIFKERNKEHTLKYKIETISLKEGILISVFISLDAFVAGIGAVIFGYPILLIVIFISSMGGLLIIVGQRIGLVISKAISIRGLDYIPPVLIILLGLFYTF